MGEEKGGHEMRTAGNAPTPTHTPQLHLQRPTLPYSLHCPSPSTLHILFRLTLPFPLPSPPRNSLWVFARLLLPSCPMENQCS